MSESQLTEIKPGRNYIYASETAWPAYMVNARVSVRTIFPGEGLTVAYGFRAVNGITGDGTMRLDFAQVTLKPAPEVTAK